jgi:hypothetical protein
MTQIPYSQVEQIIESHLIVYEGKVYETVEDLQRFPDTLTLKDQGITRQEFYDIYERLQETLRGW